MADHLVFISHSARDTWVARQISHACQQAGATTFLDEANIAVGADFEEAIRVALDKTAEMVVLLTPWALDRAYILMEIGAAWSRRLPIAVILHGLTANDLQTKTNLPVFLKQRNLIDINDVDRYFEELSVRIKEEPVNTGFQ